MVPRLQARALLQKFRLLARPVFPLLNLGLLVCLSLSLLPRFLGGPTDEAGYATPSRCCLYCCKTFTKPRAGPRITFTNPDKGPAITPTSFASNSALDGSDASSLITAAETIPPSITPATGSNAGCSALNTFNAFESSA